MKSFSISLQPIQECCAHIDKKVLFLKKKCEQPQSNGMYNGFSRLQQLIKEVDASSEECTYNLARTQRNSETFKEIAMCSDIALNYADGLVSFLETKLSMKGYNTPKQPNTKQAEKTKQNVPGKPDSMEMKRFAAVDDRTFNVKQELKKLTSIQENIKIEAVKTVKGNLLDSSPQLPTLSEDTNKKDTIQSPVTPAFLKENTYRNEKALLPSTFFNSMLSPDPADLESIKVKTIPATTSNFFELPASPVTPVFSSDSTKWGKDLKKLEPNRVVDDCEDDNIIMHSRRSFFMGETAHSPEESTVNLMKSKPLQSPETPDIGQHYVREMRAGPFMQNAASPLCYQSKQSKSSLHSPEVPDILHLKEICGKSQLPVSKRRVAPQIDSNLYNTASESIKRLLSYEQLSTAVNRIYDMSLSKSSRQFNMAEVEETTGLRGKTKCFILVLKSWNIVRTVEGDKYEFTS